MASKDRPAEELFEELAEPYLTDPAVSRGTGFGSSAGLRVEGRIFAMLDRKGELVVKLPKRRVDQLIQSGTCAPFNPRHSGRPMKEWATVPLRHRREWDELVGEAFQFVRSAGPRPLR
jgi:hypothetical protein